MGRSTVNYRLKVIDSVSELTRRVPLKQTVSQKTNVYLSFVTLSFNHSATELWWKSEFDIITACVDMRTTFKVGQQPC